MTSDKFAAVVTTAETSISKKKEYKIKLFYSTCVNNIIRSSTNKDLRSNIERASYIVNLVSCEETQTFKTKKEEYKFCDLIKWQN